jgi:hypothetical protein
MVDPVEALPVKVNAIEQKLDALTVAVDARFAAVDARFDTVDARFDEVTSALVEQRQYTEFAFDRLRREMMAGFAMMTTNFGRLERKLDQLIDRATGQRPDG